MSDHEADAGPDAPLSGGTRRNAAILMFTTTGVLFLVAAVLWWTHDPRARGAALTLVGAASAHLLKETHDLLRQMLRP